MKKIDLDWTAALTYRRALYAIPLVVMLLVINHECERRKKIPIGFSEMSQTWEQAGPVAKLLLATHDSTMKVFECWNTSHKFSILGDNTRSFQRELDFRMDPSLHIHRWELWKLLPMLPGLSIDALAAIKPYQDEAILAQQAVLFLGDAWSEQHNDHYHSETRTETYQCGDSRRSRTCTRTYTVQVYDWTDHYYWFRDRAGHSVDALCACAKTQPAVLEVLPAAKTTGAENEYAMDVSRRLEKRLAQGVLLQLANTWRTANVYAINMPSAAAWWASVPTHCEGWRRAKARARDVSYRTFSHSDSGPEPYRVSKAAESAAGQFCQRVAAVVSAFREVGASRMLTFAKNIGLKTSSRQTADLLAESMGLYQRVFPGGFDVEQFRAWPVILAALFLFGCAFGIEGPLSQFADDMSSRARWKNHF